jgi:hypothetical protein
MDSIEGPFVLKTHPRRQEQMVTVGPDGLVLQGPGSRDAGHQDAGWTYAAMAMVNLNFVMASENDESHYSCRIYMQDGRRLVVRANAGDVVEGQAWQGFVQALHRALVHARSPVRFTTGMRSQWGYRLLVGSMGLLFALTLAGIVWAMAAKGKAGWGILFILVTLAGAIFVFRMIRAMAKPGVYDPQAIPARLLPFGQ